MANLVTLSEPTVDSLIGTWTGLELWHASVVAGPYTLLVQIPYVLHQTTYTYTDSAGLTTDYYETRRYAPGPTYGSYSVPWTDTPSTSSLLSLKTTFYDYINELYQGTATGGSVSQLVDAGLVGYTSEAWPAKLEGQQIRITSGAASGDLRQVGKVDRSDGILYPNRNFSAAVASTDTYELWGTAINGGTPLTSLFNQVARGIQPIADTQLSVVTNQRMYDVSAVVSSRRQIKGVYVRLLDQSGVVPYTIRDLVPGLEWWAYDRGGAGTLSTTLEVAHPLTLATTTQQLWVRAETKFAPLTADTDFVDANYRDWLCAEAVLELSRRKQSTANYDKARWDALQTRAIQDLQSERSAWLPREPVAIATWP